MLFILWVLANVGYIWAADKYMDDPNAFMGQSFAVLIGWIVLNLVFGGVWIFG